VRHLSGRWLSGGGDGFVQAEGRLTEDNMAGWHRVVLLPAWQARGRRVVVSGPWCEQTRRPTDGAHEGNSFQNLYNYDFISWPRNNSYDDLKMLGKSYG
jgi:hypothetical protein